MAFGVMNGKDVQEGKKSAEDGGFQTEARRGQGTKASGLNERSKKKGKDQVFTSGGTAAHFLPEKFRNSGGED